jgi:hypothetical protein
MEEKFFESTFDKLGSVKVKDSGAFIGEVDNIAGQGD